MHTSRRSFIKKSALAVAGSAFLSRAAFARINAQEVTGLQLYSVRDDMKNDPMGTLKKLAAMGYKVVEHANYIDRKFYGYTPSEFKKILGDLGLKMYSGHTVLGTQHWDDSKKDFTDVWKHTVEDAAFMGQKYVISPWLDESLRTDYDNLLRFLELFNKCGELCQKHGMKFGYHNHDFEFSDSLNQTKLYDIIMQHTDPKLVIQQLDIGNMYHAGGRAEQILNQYPDRYASIHVKDEIKTPGKDNQYESTILGTGVVGTKAITDLAEQKGGAWLMIIEQESYQDKTPLDCAKEDLAIMKKWGY